METALNLPHTTFIPYLEIYFMQLSELRTRMNRLPIQSQREDGEEVLVKDSRANLSPAQLVEQKFRNVLTRGVSFFTQTARVQQF